MLVFAPNRCKHESCGMAENKDGIGGTDGAPTRHSEYSGRYEYVRKMLEHPDSNATMMWGQCALVLLDILEEVAQMRAELAQLNATNLELIVHRNPK